VHAKHVRHIGRCSILGTRFALTTVIGMTVIGMTVIGMTVIGMTQPKTAVKRVTAMTEQVLNLCVQTERLETVR
jgi:TctA family transporter